MTGFLVLSRSDLRALMQFDDYAEAVAEAFQLLAEGRCLSPVPTEIPAQDGTFHTKAGALPRGAGYVAVKINGNFPSNKARHGLPTIQGAVYLADASNDHGLAFLGSADPAHRRPSSIRLRARKREVLFIPRPALPSRAPVPLQRLSRRRRLLIPARSGRRT
jgi:hypothetical protein